MSEHQVRTEMNLTEQINITNVKEILRGLRERTKITSAILYTHDGTIAAIESEKARDEKSNDELIGVVCSNIIALAKHNIFKIKEDNKLKQISIQAGEHLDFVDGFKVVLELVRENLFLLVIVPTSLNLGVIFFELNNAIRKINKEIA